MMQMVETSMVGQAVAIRRVESMLGLTFSCGYGHTVEVSSKVK